MDDGNRLQFKPKKLLPWWLVIGAVFVLFLIGYNGATGPASAPTSSIAFNPTRICADSYTENLDFTQLQADHFTVQLREGCFGGWVHLPKTWKFWHADASGDQNGYWNAFWYANDPHGIGPYFANDTRTINKGTHDVFRLQGHGSVLFYNNQPVERHVDVKESDIPTKPSGEIRTEPKPEPLKPLGSLQVVFGTASYCEKPDDAYYQFYPSSANPRLLFDIHNNNFNNSSTPINWADGFKGELQVCFLVDEKGIPTNIHLLQQLVGAPELELHIKDVVAGWRYEPAILNSFNRADHPIIKVEMLVRFLFH
jgi:hypothetical protein